MTPQSEPAAGPPDASTADPDEVARFTAQAASWWDEDGPFRPLHRLNPVRLAYIRDGLCAHFGWDPEPLRPLVGRDVVDIGCGGGLICEPLRRLGAAVTGIDASADSIEVASRHAAASGLDIVYRQATPETLAAEGRSFDAVINMEVIEHVDDIDAFLEACTALVRPGGAMMLSTLNRTLKSFALGKVAAEYVLGWVPVGTHDWRRFVKPSELARGLRRHGMRMTDLKGMVYAPQGETWRLSRDVGVNYAAMAVKD